MKQVYIFHLILVDILHSLIFPVKARVGGGGGRKGGGSKGGGSLNGQNL